MAMSRAILLSVLVGAVTVSSHNSTSSDEFVSAIRHECSETHKFVSCIKYRVAKILWMIATNSLGYFPNEYSRAMTDGRSIRLVHLAEPSDVKLFTDSRSLQGESDFTRIMKFLKRTADMFARNHGFQLGLPSEADVRISTDETSVVEPRTRGEKKKRKWLIILPLIILMKIAHLKMTVVPLLLGIIGLNVVLVGGGGWLIHYLKYKTLCKIHPQLVQSHSHVYDSDPSEYSAFVGSSSYPGASGYYSTHDNIAYAKDWSTSNAYRGYVEK